MTDTIRKLREAVEAGRDILHALPGNWARHWQWVLDANDGSLDAALALMKAVLPGWLIEISESLDGWKVTLREAVFTGTEPMRHAGRVVSAVGFDSAGRTALLAELKALEATAPTSQSPVHLGNQLEGDSPC